MERNDAVLAQAAPRHGHRQVSVPLRRIAPHSIFEFEGRRQAPASVGGFAAFKLESVLGGSRFRVYAAPADTGLGSCRRSVSR